MPSTIAVFLVVLGLLMGGRYNVANEVLNRLASNRGRVTGVARRGGLHQASHEQPGGPGRPLGRVGARHNRTFYYLIISSFRYQGSYLTVDPWRPSGSLTLSQYRLVLVPVSPRTFFIA